MVTTNWLFRHLPRSERKSEIESAKKKEENRKVCRDRCLWWIFEMSCGNSELLKPSKLYFLLGACVPDQTDSLCVYVSVQGQELGSSSLLNGGGLKSAERRFSPRWFVPQYRKWGECRKPFGKRRPPSKLQLCRFSLSLVPTTVFYK